MKRLCSYLLILSLFLCGCAQQQSSQPKHYTATFLTLFDTVTTIMGPGESEADFQTQAQQLHDALLEYHQLFDIYHDYEGINNLKTVNDHAGIAPVTVDSAIIALLKDCEHYYTLTNGVVNVAMGSVLSLWHEARSDGIRAPLHAALPDAQKLEEAAAHMSMDSLVIDEDASMVYLSDPQAKLDVGAIAKGWATEYVAKNAPEGMMISVGGNVRATGPKAKDTPWVVGVTDPNDPNAHLHTLYLSEGSLVTSGDYQRFYAVEGKHYHHIIDPDTLYPSEYWSSVTIVCEDSGLADALSTALFLMNREDGQKLLDKYGAEALWVDREMNLYYSPGFQNLIRT